MQFFIGSITLVIGFLTIFIAGGILTQRFVNTPQFKDKNGEAIEGSIAEFKRVDIGNISQAVLIRGKSIENPVVLFLHAGPGMTETGMMRNLNSELEEHYTMVYLDQRGGGKSYSPFIDSKTMTTDRLLEDIHELTAYLKEYLDKDKIVIMGHSFGAGFATLAAATYPEDYFLCVSIGQPVCPVECDRQSYPFVLQLAEDEGNNKAIDELKSINNFWQSKDKKTYIPGMSTLKKWVGYYGGQIYGERSPTSFILGNSMSDEFTFFDWLPFFMGMGFSGNASWEIMITTDFRELAAEFEIPFFIIEGRHDINTFYPLVEDYYNLIDAPQKELFLFDNSAHFPHFEEREKFQKIMIEEILPKVKDLTEE